MCLTFKYLHIKVFQVSSVFNFCTWAILYTTFVSFHLHSLKKKESVQEVEDKTVHGLPKRSQDKEQNKTKKKTQGPAASLTLLQPGERNEKTRGIQQSASLSQWWFWIWRVRRAAVGTFILSMTALLMFPPKARSSFGVAGLGPNSASPFFFSSSTLAAAGPLAFISFLDTQQWVHFVVRAQLGISPEEKS